MKRIAMAILPPPRSPRAGTRDGSSMSMLRKLIIVAMPATMLFAAPAAALAATAPPGITRPAVSASTQLGGAVVLKPSGTSAVPNPHCSPRGAFILKPPVGARTILTCKSTVTNVTLKVCVQQFLRGKWRDIACKQKHWNRGRSFSVTAHKNCANHNKNAFRATNHARWTYRGHTVNKSFMSPVFILACGTQ